MTSLATKLDDKTICEEIRMTADALLKHELDRALKYRTLLYEKYSLDIMASLRRRFPALSRDARTGALDQSVMEVIGRIERGNIIESKFSSTNEQPLAHFLIKTAWNRATDHLRKEGRQWRLNEEYYRYLAIVLAEDPVANEAYYANEERKMLLEIYRDFAETLPKKQRAVALAMALGLDREKPEKMTDKEICDALEEENGVRPTRGSVRAARIKVRDKFRKILEPWNDDENQNNS